MIIKQKILDKMKLDIEQLAIKKLFEINENGIKVKIRRNAENEYSTYLNGNYITTDTAWQAAYDLAVVLICDK